MMQRRNRVPPIHQDRWLISYADFITLLFALFVVLFASSNADRSKARQASDAMRKAFSSAAYSKPKNGTTHPVPGDQASLNSTIDELRRSLAPEILAGKMGVRMERRGIVVSLSQASFFPSGEDSVDPAMIVSLGKVASVIATLPNLVRLEGHTDSIPIHTARFRSNWDLSSARAITTMQLLRDHWNIANRRLAVTGYADTVPIDSNDDESGRAHNRRVDVVILNDSGSSAEPLGGT